MKTSRCWPAWWRTRGGRGPIIDWSAPAGTLDWTCTRTADHAVDTVLAPAFFLASRRQDDYPAAGPFSLGPDPAPKDLAEALETAARILASVVTATPADVRAIIWRRPKVEIRPPADFAPRGALELALHAHDVGCGLGLPFVPPAELAEHLRAHTQHWPAWGSPGWTPLTMDGDPWIDLLRSSGRGTHRIAS